MSCDRYELLVNEGALAAASNSLTVSDDTHGMIAISGRALAAHLRDCDICQAAGRDTSAVGAN